MEKEKRPLGRRKIWRLDAAEAWTKWGFKEEGTANSVTCWIKDNKNSKCTTGRGDVEVMVTVMGATSEALGKEDGFDWRRGQRRVGFCVGWICQCLYKLGMVGKYETMYDDDSSFQVLFSSANFFLKYQNLFKTHKLYMWVQKSVIFKSTGKLFNLFNLNNLN